MSEALWSWKDLVAASGGIADVDAPHDITGFSIDTRSLGRGDVFVALTDQRDGHAFVPAAFAAGAAAALVRADYVRAPGDGALIRVDDPLRALERIARAARTRLASDARVIAVTGSAGKTGTKEMLRVALEALAPGRVHASIKSFNNHWGVPLMLASMPADARFAVFEIGMNHAGEIAPLTRMVRPHVALVTNVLPVHIGNFADGEIGIANAKAEIFEGLVPGGAAIVPFDNPHCERLAARAVACGGHVTTFGMLHGADVRKIARVNDGEGTVVLAVIRNVNTTYRVGMAGAHISLNSLGAVAALDALGLDLAAALLPIADLSAPQGRGARTVFEVAGGRVMLVDESYNANPASMSAAIATAGDMARREGYQRLVLVMGDMLELGRDATQFHLGLADRVMSQASAVFACGSEMKHLFDTLPVALQAGWAPTSAELQPLVVQAIRAGDTVMVKGSLGSRMGPVVEAIKTHFAPSR